MNIAIFLSIATGYMFSIACGIAILFEIKYSNN